MTMVHRAYLALPAPRDQVVPTDCLEHKVRLALRAPRAYKVLQV